MYKKLKSQESCSSSEKFYRTRMMPSDLPALFLEDITERFSDQLKVGSGGYGEVYKVCLILLISVQLSGNLQQ